MALRYRRGGTNYSITLYTSTYPNWEDSLRIREGGTTKYAQLDSNLSHANASYMRVRKNSTTYAVLHTREDYITSGTTTVGSSWSTSRSSGGTPYGADFNSSSYSPPSNTRQLRVNVNSTGYYSYHLNASWNGNYNHSRYIRLYYYYSGSWHNTAVAVGAPGDGYPRDYSSNTVVTTSVAPANITSFYVRYDYLNIDKVAQTTLYGTEGYWETLTLNNYTYWVYN